MEEEHIYYVFADDLSFFEESGYLRIDIEFCRAEPIERQLSHPPQHTDESINHGFTNDEAVAVKKELERSGKVKNIRIEGYKINGVNWVNRFTFADAAGGCGEYAFEKLKLDCGLIVQLTAQSKKRDRYPFKERFFRENAELLKQLKGQLATTFMEN